MTTCLGKSCSFGLPRVPFVDYVFSYFPFGFEGRMWDLIVSIPDNCLSFYFRKCPGNAKRNEPVLEIMVRITYATSEGSGEIVHMRSLAKALAVRTHDEWK